MSPREGMMMIIIFTKFKGKIEGSRDIEDAKNIALKEGGGSDTSTSILDSNKGNWRKGSVQQNPKFSKLQEQVHASRVYTNLAPIIIQ